MDEHLLWFMRYIMRYSMSSIKKYSTILAIGLLSALVVTCKAEKKVSEILIEKAEIRLVPQGDNKTVGFMKIMNATDDTVVLKSVESELAETIQIEKLNTSNDVIDIEVLSQVSINPHGILQLESGGTYISFTGLQKTLADGDTVALTLNFENKSVQTEAIIKAAKKEGISILGVVIQVLGGLAVFLFGMKVMSESLQNVAGDDLKDFLGKMTTNRFTGALSGMGITTAIQSSSATTVMVVGFVNASLMNLRQAVSVIMGANIGTTITAWIVAILGFKIQISVFALPAIFFGLVMIFMKSEKIKGWGSALVGFGLLFLGLQFLKDGIPDAAANPESFVFLEAYTSMGFLSVILFVLFGTLITVVVQSSSAASAITITLAHKGVIPYETALAMILGENIGTTITANLAALAGNRNAKKAAVAHTIFNVFGVVWVLALFYPATWLLQAIIPGDPVSNPDQIRYHISTFHTLFNITNTTLLIGFVGFVAKYASVIVDKLVPGQEEEKKYDFRFLQSGSIKTTEIPILELKEYSYGIFQDTENLLETTKSLINEKYSNKKVSLIFDAEDELDTYRAQMLNYLGDVQASGVSGTVGKQLLFMFNMVQNLEDIGDDFANIARKVKKITKQKLDFDDESKQMLNEMFNKVNDQFLQILENYNNLGDREVRTDALKLRKESEKSFKSIERTFDRQSAKKKKKVLLDIVFMDIVRIVNSTSDKLYSIATTGQSFH